MAYKAKKKESGAKVQSVSDALKELGFERVQPCAGGILLASVVQDFGKAHAKAIQTLGDRANFVRVNTTCGPVLRVRVLKQRGEDTASTEDES